MANEKTVKLVDRRRCCGVAVEELRGVLAGIESGEVIGVSFATVKRDGGSRVYSNADSALKALGSVDLLRQYIIKHSFEELL